MFMKRWGPTFLVQKKEFEQFMKKVKPGDIFKEAKPLPFASGVDGSGNQTQMYSY
jgi:hypothetical protein